ncbi:hypothetical protein AVEN_232606-1 [Araneus ventricosus]|uniref:Uncharacterized protein n=1 Tax=Araneus ventricosus TaxID=182803 RepID=A0A4Y2JQ57_ARAVE|nr:hypothetical protein AVEN_232606-1 [Araneus ventricosus]
MLILWQEKEFYRGFNESQAIEPRLWRQNEASRKRWNYDPVSTRSVNTVNILCDVTSCRKKYKYQATLNDRSVRVWSAVESDELTDIERY